jgi:hypothetical protein
MGHYDECREGYCIECGQTIGNCEHTNKNIKTKKLYNFKNKQEIYDCIVQLADTLIILHKYNFATTNDMEYFNSCIERLVKVYDEFRE